MSVFSLEPWGANPPPTPFYAYRESDLDWLWDAFPKEIPGLTLHFAMKSNSNPQLLACMRARGVGVDLVSGGELELARRAGFAPEKMVFSGVGKTNDELAFALRVGVGLLNVESRGELERLERIAREGGFQARFGLRVNPDVDARTHPYISTGLSAHKFGVDFTEARELYLWAAQKPALRATGISVHIGSQMMDLSALTDALRLTIDFAEGLKRADSVPLEVLDVGGGLGVDYREPRRLPPFADYGRIVSDAGARWRALQGANARLGSECGRALVAQAGYLVTRVIGLKQNGSKHFAILDASMTELLRPSLYQAWHPVSWLRGADGEDAARRGVATYDIVGPVCESADVLAQDRSLPELREGDWLAIGCAGAYGHVMSGHYNARPSPAEWWLPKQGAPRISRAPRAAWELGGV